MKKSTSSAYHREKGAVVVLVALLLIVFLGIAAFVTDFGYRHVVKNELQNAVDAAVLAGARELSKIYEPMSYDEQQSYVLSNSDKTAIIAAVQKTALSNYAGNEKDLDINSADIFIGDWDSSTVPNFFTATTLQPDAVKAIVRRQTGYNSGPIGTFFGRVLGVKTLTIQAEAIAALTGQSTAGVGDIELPVGIDEKWFDDPFCDDEITFHPTKDSCAGWHAFKETVASDSVIRKDILDVSTGDPDDPAYLSPEINQNESINFIGGDLSTNTFNELLNAYRNKGYDIDVNGDKIPNPNQDPDDPDDDFIHWVNSGTPASAKSKAIPLCEKADGSGLTTCYEADGTTPNSESNSIPAMYPEESPPYADTYPRYDHIWETLIPVYKSENCGNPSGMIEVVGFAEVVVTNIEPAPNKLINGIIKCNFVSLGRGGGSDFGTKGSIPNIVQ